MDGLALHVTAALAEGRIGDDFAYNAAQVLSMERVGEGWEAAQRELAELIGKVGPEELAAAQGAGVNRAVVERLTKSGLATEVVQTKGDFDRLATELNGRPLTAGEEVYAFCDVSTGKVYLNPDFFATRQGLDAPLHEFGHLGSLPRRR